MIVVGHGERSTIVIGERASWLERHAAEELQVYVERMSGATLPLLTEGEVAENDRPVVLIGRADSCVLLQQMIERGLLHLSPDTPGEDGFIIRTVNERGRDWLVLGGSNERGALYAVYHFLEHVLKCGFFEDGERIPKAQEITVEDLDIREKPFFRYRSYMSPCAQHYSASYWSLDDWKYEIDWMAKKKLNMLRFWPVLVRGSMIGERRETLAVKRTWKALGLSGVGNTDEDEATRLSREIMEYARQRGMEIITDPGFSGAVPVEFREEYPNCKYLEVTWEQTAPRLNLDPADPMFAKVLEINLQEHIKLYGANHRYDYAMYPETAPGGSREEGMRLRRDFARAVSKGIKAVDPQGQWHLDSWCFLGHPDLSPQEVQSILDVLPNDSAYVCDTWADAYHLYERHDHFFGKSWGFAVLHAMGGDGTMHGDMHGITKKLKDLASNPEAALCQYFTLVMEIVKHNIVYYDLLMQLSWDPRKVDVPSFLRDYALRRYGPASAQKMTSFLQKLLESVYTTEDWTGPQYRPCWAVQLGRGFTLETRVPFANKLRAGLKLALEEKDEQASNPLYMNDLVNVGRQFLGELYNYHWIKLERAFAHRDEDAVAHEGEVLCDILERQAELLEPHPDFHISTEIEQAVACGLEPAVAARVIKARFTFLGLIGSCSWDQFPLFLLDYARDDRYELLKYYYLPRVRFYLEKLSTALANERGKPITPAYPSAEDLQIEYRDFAYNFVEKPLPETGVVLGADSVYQVPNRVEEILARYKC